MPSAYVTMYFVIVSRSQAAHRELPSSHMENEPDSQTSTNSCTRMISNDFCRKVGSDVIQLER